MKRSNMKKKKERWLAAGLAIVLLASILFPALAFAAESEDDAIHIQSQDDLRTLAENCRLDTWSQGKTVILDKDIVLDEDAQDFLPIPTFGGSFEGEGHTISGFSLTGEDSKAGLFDTLQESAVVSDLKVVGQVAPGGSSDTIGGLVGTNYGKLVDCSFEGAVQGKNSVGGLVGINETTGQLVSCRFQGTVTGEHYVGGIAGQNTGSLLQCQNDGEVNTTAVEVSAELPDLSLLGTTESVPAGTDIGGIAGFSSGVIQNCTNTGNVGYDHMGYNVGGIAGRQSGYLNGCRNTGTIKGRKDVGGIAGQLEPQVTLRYNEDLLDKLWTELDTLQGLANQATNDAKNTSSTLAGSFDSLSANISAAKDAVSGLSGALTDWGNGNAEQINDLSDRLSWVISQTEPVLDSVSEAFSCLETASQLLQQAAGKVDTADEQGAAAAAELQQAAQELQSAADHAKSCTAHLRGALELAQQPPDGDIAGRLQSILNELNAAVADVQSAKDALESARSHAASARSCLEQMGESGASALADLDQAMEQLAPATSALGAAIDSIGQIVADLADEPSISFNPVDSNVTTQGDALDAALSQVITNANNLRGSLTSASDTLLNDMNAINNQLGVIVDLVRQEMERTQEKDTADSFEDISDEASSDPAAGKILESVNGGQVQGDVNVAGIVGSMSVEYDFDPEDDLTKDGTRSLDFQYRTLAVVTGCTNEGGVTAKKDYAGGIVGRMDLGAVKSCESYGEVESESGDYVGGIAGVCRATIRGCYAKCSLSGGNYMGGVAGASEDNTVISGCYTLVEISDGGHYTGAVCGTEDGEFTENYYVSDTLAGLGRISYAGKAEPISFESLRQVSGMPDKMTQFTLRFVVEDEEIKSCNFSYGASFGPEVFPEIPVKDGYYASWDTQDLTDLHFDKTVTAEYVRYVMTLSSDVSRSSGRPVFLMDGNFDDDAVLTVTQTENPELVAGKPAEEQWNLSCSDGSQESYTVRYLSPDETAEGYTVYVRSESGWQKAACSAFGSYLVFTVASGDVDVAIVPASSVWLQCVVVCAVVLLLLLVLLIVFRKKRRAKKKKAPAPVQSTEETKGEATAKNKPSGKKRWLILLLFLLVLVIAAGCVVVGVKFAAAADACKLLQEFAAQPESAMTLSLNVQLDDTLTNTEMDITRTTVEDHAVTCIENSGISLYYADDAVILENGRAFTISDLHPDYSLLPEQAAELFKTVSFSTTRSGSNVTCQLTAEGDNARQLLQVLLPDQADALSDTQKLTVELTSSEGAILSLRFSSEGTLTDTDNTAYSVTAELKPQSIDPNFAVPDAVKETVCSEDMQEKVLFSEDLFRLLSAWTSMSREDSFSADVQLNVACGSISLDESMKYGQAVTEDTTISFVRKDDLAVYFSDGTFCDQNGVLLSQQDNTLADRAHLLEVLKQICLNGEFDCTDTGNSTWLYTLTLDEDAMKAIAYAAAPEMESLPVTLASGSVQITVNGSEIREIECSCTGGLEALEKAAPVTVSVKVIFAHNSQFDVPLAVKDRLIEERMKENGE